MDGSIVVARPEQPQQLMLLLHGSGTSAQSMVPVGERLLAEFPAAFIVCLSAPMACEGGTSRQWFAVDGVTDANRLQRVAESMPALVDTVKHWQAESGLGVVPTALLGFSQGAIMALESTQQPQALAGRVIAVAGRFASLPERAPPESTLHLFHGKADPVIPYAHTVAAAETLIALGGDVTADVVPFLTREIDDALVELIIERLRGHIPKRLWDAALQAQHDSA